MESGEASQGRDQAQGPRAELRGPLEVWGPTWGPGAEVQSAGACCPFRLRRPSPPSTNLTQLWQPGDPHPDHWAWTWSLPALGSALGCVSCGDGLWGPQLPLMAVLAPAPPQETPPGHPALIPTLSAPPPPSPAAWGPLPCPKAEHPKQPPGGMGASREPGHTKVLCVPALFPAGLLLGTPSVWAFHGGFLWRPGRGPGDGWRTAPALL